ncbi:MAG: phospholipase D family protein [Pseudomonadota bacterium]|nr:phospholipase D family protein [Pseudomonadota bacterium]
MTVTARMLFDRPQQKIAPIIRDLLARCRDAQIVSGFATPDGIEALRATRASARISRFVLGAGTFKAFETLDQMIAGGLPPAAARIHLGLTRATGTRKHPFARYRPMLHSKIYYFDLPGDEAAAVVGSNNLTGFALRGLNGEAAVLLEGPSADPVFEDIRNHIAESYRQARPYDSSLKAAYAQWYKDYLDQLGIVTTDMPRDSDSTATLILYAEAPVGALPTVGDHIYFEIDIRLEEVRRIGTEVHLHLLPTLPSTPREALNASTGSNPAYFCKIEMIDATSGSAEQKADWLIDHRASPRLRPAPRPFRPTLTVGMQQVRVRIERDLEEQFDYLFDSGKGVWRPELGQEGVNDEATGTRWQLVQGFNEQGADDAPLLLESMTPREMLPGADSFILFSRRRRRLGRREST